MTTVHSPENAALLSKNDSSSSALTGISGKKTLPPLVPALIFPCIAFHLLNSGDQTTMFPTAFTEVSLKITSVKLSRLAMKFIHAKWFTSYFSVFCLALSLIIHYTKLGFFTIHQIVLVFIPTVLYLDLFPFSIFSLLLII